MLKGFIWKKVPVSMNFFRIGKIFLADRIALLEYLSEELYRISREAMEGIHLMIAAPYKFAEYRRFLLVNNVCI